ncbi:23S rRNA (guanosine(2251)-2'-O)-methyltransferase RlmB [Rarobacter faecitabidus]|uniref:23S rRNA (Guanosine2251-2'-O)-methyltransferase n=1 Tax=Rarobacter faecitabidus TaxID=13243 RepID=A0A542ZTL8_RARFA|nr:23S rRNA (guanosine(2251)-2'-O)-methyltransferase RlmB [Rarobacter faecitabidus]TQL63705.1 23S rRNA (guanosine2251-2'-O)-methyltransferase [Rarobacter faecitabidus]
MAGNSQRKGAVRKLAKNPKVGSGGQSRRALEGRGPTPKAEDRPYHKAYQAKQERESASRPSSVRRGSKGENEVIVGRNAVLEALRAEIKAKGLFISGGVDSDDRLREILQLAAEQGRPIMESSRRHLDDLADGGVHQGVAMEVAPYEYADPEDLLDFAAERDELPLIVALDSVTDPRNLGAALRSAGAFGAHGVLVPARRAAGVTAAAWKVSAGAAARVPVAKATNLVRALTDYKKAGLFVIGLDAGGNVDIADLPFANDPLVVVIGAEGAGLSRLVRETCDAIVSIPIASAVESLNAAVAGGVALYEVAKQRRQA